MISSLEIKIVEHCNQRFNTRTSRSKDFALYVAYNDQMSPAVLGRAEHTPLVSTHLRRK